MINQIIKDGWYFGEDYSLIDVFTKNIEIQTKFTAKSNILYPNKIDNSKISLSKLYGLNAFPFHTDGVQFEMPPKYLILNLLSSDVDIAKTLLIDGFQISQNAKSVFYNSIFLLRGNNFKEWTPLINSGKIKGELILRYNPVIMQPIIKKKEILLNQILEESPKIEIDWKPNSYLIIDNWRMLHAREAIKNTTNSRVIQRTELYIQ